MFKRLKRLYDLGRLTAENLKKAVDPNGWITEDEYKTITGTTYGADKKEETK